VSTEISVSPAVVIDEAVKCKVAVPLNDAVTPISAAFTSSIKLLPKSAVDEPDEK